MWVWQRWLYSKYVPSHQLPLLVLLFPKPRSELTFALALPFSTRSVQMSAVSLPFTIDDRHARFAQPAQRAHMVPRGRPQPLQPRSPVGNHATQLGDRGRRCCGPDAQRGGLEGIRGCHDRLGDAAGESRVPAGWRGGDREEDGGAVCRADVSPPSVFYQRFVSQILTHPLLFSLQIMGKEPPPPSQRPCPPVRPPPALDPATKAYLRRRGPGSAGSGSVLRRQEH